MKTISLLTTFAVVFLLNCGFDRFTTPTDPFAGKTNSAFSLVRSGDNIMIYSRWIPATEARLTRQLKAEFDVNCPVENILKVLSDEKSYTQWMKASKTYYRLKTINETEWLAYVQFSIPWPLDNQDCILKYVLKKSADQSEIVITLSSEPNYLKPIEGVERIMHLQAMWVITKTGNDKTHVEYYVYSNQPPKFATWITDPLIQKNLIKTMSALRSIAVELNN